MEVLLVLAIGLVSVSAFLVGAKVGQAVARGEKVELPKVVPARVQGDRKAAELELDRVNTIMRNIETYDGTAFGQQDVPGR